MHVLCMALTTLVVFMELDLASLVYSVPRIFTCCPVVRLCRFKVEQRYVSLVYYLDIAPHEGPTRSDFQVLNREDTPGKEPDCTLV